MIRALLFLAVLVLPQVADAKPPYRFPATPEHYPHYYVTAYYDHAGNDWNCGTHRYSGHRGTDYGVGSWAGMDAGRDVVAAADGVVAVAHDGEFDRCSTGNCAGGGGYGNYVRIDHDDGRRTYYAHLKQWSVAVSVGQHVGCGTYLGQVGSSGYSTGPHLHFEVREASGARVDSYGGDCSSSPVYWDAQGSYRELPGLHCEDVEPCNRVSTLTCGDSVEARNDGPGHTRTHSHYGCTAWTYTGPELAFAFATHLDEPVTVTVTGLAADLDLYVLDSAACDGQGCLGASTNPGTDPEAVSFEATAGSDYTFVVDGWKGAVSDFSISVDCEGTWPPPEPPQDTDDPTATPGATGGPGQRASREAVAGCGCASAPPSLLPWLGLLALLRRSRRGDASRVESERR